MVEDDEALGKLLHPTALVPQRKERVVVAAPDGLIVTPSVAAEVVGNERTFSTEGAL